MADDVSKPPENFFRSAKYISFWISSLFSNIGTWMQQIAEPWVVLNLSNSPFWVGLDSFALNAPAWLFTLVGGILADRFDRKKTVLFFQTLQFFCVVILIALLVLGWLKVWMIVCISFLVGLTDSLSMPSFQSIIPSVVSAKDIPRAVSLNSIQFNLSRILGPTIAGIIMARWGAVACFSSNAASYIPFFLSIYFIYPRGGIKIQRDQTEEKPMAQLSEFRKLFQNDDVRLPLFTILVNNFFCGTIITFAPVLIKEMFHAQVESYSGAVAAFGVGGLIGAGISFLPFPPSLKRNRLAAALAVLLGLVVAAIALNRSLAVLIILLTLAGAALTAVNISVNTFLQSNASNTFRGRIASMYQLALSGGISLGALATGFVISKLNIADALFINGTLAVLFQIFLLWRQWRKTKVAAN